MSFDLKVNLEALLNDADANPIDFSQSEIDLFNIYQPEPGCEPQPQTGSQRQPETGLHPDPETGPEAEPETGLDPQPEPETGLDPQPEPEPAQWPDDENEDVYDIFKRAEENLAPTFPSLMGNVIKKKTAQWQLDTITEGLLSPQPSGSALPPTRQPTAPPPPRQPPAPSAPAPRQPPPPARRQPSTPPAPRQPPAPPAPWQPPAPPAPQQPHHLHCRPPCYLGSCPTPTHLTITLEDE